MATLTSRNTGHRVRHEMEGRIEDFLGVTFSHIDGRPSMMVSMRGESGRSWVLQLDPDETAKVGAALDRARSLRP